jgi:hypothetical protein
LPLVTVVFGDSGTAPTPESAAALDSVAPLLKLFQNRRYELHGYFCPSPDSAGAARAAGERVKAVGNYLVASGVPSANIAAVKAGYAGNGPCARVAIVSVAAQLGGEEADSAELATATESATESDADSATAEPSPDPATIPAEAHGKPTVAIYTAGEEPPAVKGVHRILGGELAKTISESGKYIAVDRTEDILTQIAKEHLYQRDGAVDDDQIKALGQQLGAQYLCISNINPAGDRSYYLDIRLVDVVTAEIIRTATANSSLKDAAEKTRVARGLAFELIETEKAVAQRKRKKRISLTTAIGLDALGAATFLYGVFENGNVVTHSENRIYTDAEKSATRRDAAYIVGAVLMVSGVSVHVFF